MWQQARQYRGWDVAVGEQEGESSKKQGKRDDDQEEQSKLTVSYCCSSRTHQMGQESKAWHAERGSR